MRQARNRLTKDIASGLRKLGASVAKQLRQLDKARSAKDIVDELDLEGLSALIDPTEAQLKAIVDDTASKVLSQLGVDDRASLVNQVNEAAADFAHARAAEMVGMRYDENGDLVEAKRAEYAIDDTTRDMLRDTIADGLEDKLSLDDIAADIEDNFAFSEERAMMIARTETTRANNQSSLISATKARDELGIKLTKNWLSTDDEDVDEEICLANEDDGPIELDQDFSSGDDAPPGHPNCRCTLVYDRDTSDDEEDEENDD